MLHELRFDGRLNQYVDVSLSLPALSGNIDLSMPVWTPGSYLIRDYASHVERVRATAATGEVLPVEKQAKNRWRISQSGSGPITFQYRVWAGELGVHTNWIESEFAVLNGAGVFLYNEETRDLQQRLRVIRPSDWQTVAVALPQDPDSGDFLARDFDQLVDSPLLIGNPELHSFEYSGRQYTLALQGETRLWDGRQAAEDLAKIVTANHEFWQSDPFELPYWIINLVASGSGGLEHDHSTVLLSHPWQMRYRNDYIRWLSLFAHEYFHAWNVRRLRPEALRRYDYEGEVYTRELWLAEGLTSYYDNLLLFRSGLISVGEFLDLLADEIRQYEQTPGRHVRSAEAASFDSWIKQYKPDANSPNSVVSYYRKGALIALVTDMAIRKATRGEFSLDDVMRNLYRRYGPNGTNAVGYPSGAFEYEVQSLAGSEVASSIRSLIVSVEDPDVDAALAWVGLELQRAPARATAEASGTPAPADLGVSWVKDSPLLLIETVLQGGSGAAAGLLPADEVLALAGTRVDKSNIQDRLLRLVPGEQVEILLSRHGRIISLPVSLQHAVPEKYQILISPGINRQEKQRMSEWLGMELKFVRN